jgi:TPP-dependent pyruvate/acetoin dehydrogenase alpha subunit
MVGTAITEAVGAGLAVEHAQTDQIVVAFFGEGAVLHGRFHEGLNLAGLWKLPIVFVCENNEYIDQTKFDALTSQPRIALRARACGVRAAEVDGNDVTSIYEEAHEAIRIARSHDGPSLIECRTYRARPFVEGVEEKPPRPSEEKDEWLANDPIVNLGRKMLDSEFATKRDFGKVERETVQEVMKAHNAAKDASFP